jgi:hypothetical protein
MMTAHVEFEVHKLNEDGLQKARDIAFAFDEFLTELEDIVDAGAQEGRLMAIVHTKLEEACFFTKKAMASKSENQE